MKKTKWFPHKIKPVREGVYETRYFGNGYSYWTGKKWGWEGGTPREAVVFLDRGGAAQDKSWRGLLGGSIFYLNAQLDYQVRHPTNNHTRLGQCCWCQHFFCYEYGLYSHIPIGFCQTGQSWVQCHVLDWG